MTTNVNKLNTLVATFFEEHNGSENINEVWLDPEFQKKLKSLFAGAVRSGQKRKDPNAPKRGKSAYLFYCSAQREKVKQLLGQDAKATEITAKLGELWKQLKANPKKKKELDGYIAQAAEDKARYLKDKESYVPPENTGGKAGRRKKDPKTGPKRAKSGYLFFCDEHRSKIKAENPNMSAVDVTSELGRQWNELKAQGEKAIKKYNDLAAKDKVRYESEKNTGATPEPAKGKAAAKPKQQPVVEEEDEIIEEENEPEPPPKAKPKATAAKGKAAAKGKK